MSVDGINSNGSALPPERGGVQRHAEGRAPDVNAPQRADRQGADRKSPTPQRDQVELSDAARDLAGRVQTAGTEAVRGEVMPEKLTIIAKRLGEGFYESDAIRDVIARRVLQDLR